MKKVIANTWYYTHRLTGRVASMRELVGTVPGRASDAPDPALAAIP